MNTKISSKISKVYTLEFSGQDLVYLLNSLVTLDNAGYASGYAKELIKLITTELDREP